MKHLFYTLAIWFLIVSYHVHNWMRIVYGVLAIAYLVFGYLEEREERKVARSNSTY